MQCWLVQELGQFTQLYLVVFLQNHLKDRILDADCSIVITADEAIRGGKNIPLKMNVDTALLDCPDVSNCLVIKRKKKKKKKKR